METGNPCLARLADVSVWMAKTTGLEWICDPCRLVRQVKKFVWAPCPDGLNSFTRRTSRQGSNKTSLFLLQTKKCLHIYRVYSREYVLICC